MSRKREEISKSAQSMTDVLALQHSYRVNKDVFIHSARMNESFISEMFAYVARFVGFLMNSWWQLAATPHFNLLFTLTWLIETHTHARAHALSSSAVPCLLSEAWANSDESEHKVSKAPLYFSERQTKCFGHSAQQQVSVSWRLENSLASLGATSWPLLEPLSNSFPSPQQGSFHQWICAVNTIWP